MGIHSFLDHLRYEKNYSEKTVVSYEGDLTQFDEYVKGIAGEAVKPEEVDPGLIRGWVISLMDKGYTSTSVNRKLSSLRTFYKYLRSKGVVRTDPLKKITGPKNKKPLPAFIKESEMNKVLELLAEGEGFEAYRNRLIILMFYTTGMRRSELVGLNESDVDLAGNVIKVTGKRNKQRLIPFDAELREAIVQYLETRSEVVSGLNVPFFVRRTGERLTDQWVYNFVKRTLSKVVSVKKKSPHVLRHTFATSMLNNDADLGAVKELLGHSSLATTEKYTHTIFEELKKVYKQAHPRA